MQIDQGTQATTTGAVTENVLAGRPSENVPMGARACRVSITGEAAGESRITIYAGSRIVMPEGTISRANRVPVIPDDVLTQFAVRGGEKVIIRHRNTGAGTNTIFWRVDYR